MTLFADTIEREFPDLHRQGVRVRFVGRRDRCPESLRALMDDMEARTAANTRLDLWVAFDYGSRDEIVGRGAGAGRGGHAARGRSTRSAVRAHLYAPEMPDPDLVIRTSGEVRISNFLLWQSAYAELRVRADAVARLRRRRARRRASGLRAAPAPVRSAVSNLASRIVVAVPLGAAAIYAALEGGWLLVVVVAVAAVIALHEFYAMVRDLRPLVPAGLRGRRRGARGGAPRRRRLGRRPAGGHGRPGVLALGRRGGAPARGRPARARRPSAPSGSASASSSSSPCATCPASTAWGRSSCSRS